MTHCLGHGHFSNPTDTGTAHRSRARRVHRAPHPRASTASSNPAERSAAEIRRESHRPRAARRVVRATLGFDIQLASIQLRGCAWYGRTAQARGGRLEAEREPRPRASYRETSPIRVSRTSAYSTAGAHAPTTPWVLSRPRLASSLPNPPRGVLSSTHAAPETRVICERFANRGPEHAFFRRGTGRVIRRTNDTR